MTYDADKNSKESWRVAIDAMRKRREAAVKRTEHIGDATLYLGDCLEILPTLPKVDAVVTDPPYEAEAHRAERRITGRNRGVIAEAFSFGAVDLIRDDAARLIVSVCDGWALTFCMAEGISAWRDAYESAGGNYKRAMVWIKPDAMPQFNGQGPAAGFECLTAVWCGSGYSKWNGGGRVGTFFHNKNSGGKHLHETQKPISLMSELVTLFSNKSETILDPFMGSGTTGVACAKLGRKFIGIEIEPKYFDIACKRIEDAYRQGDFFVDPPKQLAIQDDLGV